MQSTLAELAEATCTQCIGDGNAIINNVSTLEKAGVGDIGFLANSKYRSQLKNTRASAVIVSSKDAELSPCDVLVSSNPYLTYAQISNILNPSVRTERGIHNAAIIDPSSKIATTASIGANTVIGRNVRIAANVVIGPNCVIESDVVIGASTRIIASVTVLHGSIIGSGCVLHPGSVVGSDGFGLANDAGQWERVPQLGKVILGDNVDVGANTTIDRGSLDDTVIGDGVKLDNQIQIAHNVVLGEHIAMAACAGVAGSTTIGAYSTVAGAGVVLGHLELAERVNVSSMSMVTHSIRDSGTYTGGVPAMPHGQWQKNIARLKQLDKMVKRVKALENELNQLKSEKI